VQQVLALLADLHRVAAVGVHDPDVLGAVAVTDERDARAVRAEARLEVPLDAVGQRLGLAAVDPHAVDVAEHVEHQMPAVGADVHVRPARLARVDGDRLAIRRAVR
jgi:hypothetical protein